MHVKALLILSALVLSACAGGDKGVEDAGHVDMASSDAAEPTGTLLLTGSYDLLGLTKSGLLVVVDIKSGAASTVDPKTAVITQIAPKADGGVYVIGDAVFVSHDVDADYLGGLGVWTAALGYHDLGATKANLYRVFTDGTHVVYSNNTDETTFASDMVVDTLDHASPKTLFTQQFATYAPLMPTGKIILGHVAAAAATTGPITSYDLTTGIGTDLIASGSIYYSGNTQNTALFTTTTNGPLILDFTTGDQIGLPALVTGGVFSYDGKSLLASTSGNELEVITWSGTTPSAQTPIVTSNLGGVIGGSNDNKHALYYTSYDQSSYASDLQLTTLGAPAMHETLAPSGVNYVNFSDDSAYVAFMANQDMTTYIGTVIAAPVSTGLPTTLSKTAITFEFGNAGQLYIIDNVSTPNYTVDLELASLATPSAPLKKILKQVDYDMVTNVDTKTEFYTQDTSASPGIYMIALP